MGDFKGSELKPSKIPTLIVGVIFIILGAAIMLYGDYFGGSTYILPGAGVIALGTALWAYNDCKNGMFSAPGSKKKRKSS